MATQYGSMKDMTLDQFEKSINFYKTRIAKIEADNSIDENTKTWFIKNYTKKIESLTKAQERLEYIINNEIKDNNSFVDKRTETLNSMGDRKNVKDAFADIKYPSKKIKLANTFKIVGAILLPIVGTIPFLISLKKSKLRQKAIQNKLMAENNKITNFVNDSNRPYDKNLGSNTSFTETEMYNMLSSATQDEVERIITVLNSGTLPPDENKNLTKKLIELRAYAQKNGIAITAPSLTAINFQTKLDKIDSETSAYFRTLAPSSNIKNYSQVMNKLDNFKTESSALSSDFPENAILSRISSAIDSNKTTFQTSVKALVQPNLNALTTNLNTARAANNPTDLASANNLKSALENIFNNDFETTFGLSFDESKTYVDELKLTTDLNNFKSTYDSLISEANEKIAQFELSNNWTSKITEINNAIAELDIGGTYEISNLNSTTLENAKEIYSKIKSDIDYLKTNQDKVDPTQKAQYPIILNRFVRLELDFIKKRTELGYSKIGFENYQRLIKKNISSLSISKLIQLQTDLEAAKADVEQESYKTAFTENNGNAADFTKFTIALDKKIEEVKTQIKNKETVNGNYITELESKINSLRTKFSSNKNNINALTSIEDALETIKKEIDDCQKTISDPAIKSDLLTLLSKVSTLSSNVTLQKTATSELNAALDSSNNEINTYKNTIEAAIQRLQFAGSDDEKKAAAQQLLFISTNLTTIKNRFSSSRNPKAIDLVKTADDLISHINKQKSRTSVRDLFK